MRKARQIDTDIYQLITICSIGTILEWYDFSIYAYLVATISEKFFPMEDAAASLFFVYLVFAIGFVARPIGALLFGHFGDRVGRKNVLVTSMALMAMATFLIGVLPDYGNIGLLAPVLLISCRLLQGVAIGG